MSDSESARRVRPRRRLPTGTVSAGVGSAGGAGTSMAADVSSAAGRRPRRRTAGASAGGAAGRATGAAAASMGAVSGAGRRPRRRGVVSETTGASTSGAAAGESSTFGLRGARRRTVLGVSVDEPSVFSGVGENEASGVSPCAASPAAGVADAGVRRVLGIIVFNSPYVKWCVVGDAGSIILDSMPGVKVWLKSEIFRR